MLFNSIQFLLFFPVVFILYWLIPAKKRGFQNILLLGASFYFYACWDWRFLFLLIFSISLDFFTGFKITSSTSDFSRKFWFYLSILVNLLLLAFFKYCNFFIESFIDLFHLFQIELDYSSISIVLPIGISFYTFHGLSYVIDLYKGKIESEKNIVDYALFVSFFPLLVAGPIERATHLLPQIKKIRLFDYSNFSIGLKIVIWGFFKKVVIADRLSEYVDIVFNNPTNYHGFPILIAILFFAFQIYCDFSGYTDIARGIAKMMGFDLIKNFDRPYSSKSLKEFWSKWHISLSTWFRDYLYIPLGGNRRSSYRTYFNIFITFVVSGFWHGANWTFLIWGAIHGFILLLETWHSTFKIKLKVPNLFSKLYIFSIVCFAWTFFRANQLNDVTILFDHLFSLSSDSIFIISKTSFILCVLFILFMEFIHYQGDIIGIHAKLIHRPTWIRLSFYFSLVFIILFLGIYKKHEFIYFQF